MKRKVFWILSFIILASCIEKPEKKRKTVYVAAASSLINVVNMSGEIFEKQYPSCKVEFSIASSGSLYSSLNNGAPYHIFMGADDIWPQRIKKDLNLSFDIKDFAKGFLLLWTKDSENFDPTQKVVIADYNTAPYGKAALTWLKKQNLLKKYNIIISTSASKIPFTIIQGGFSQAIIPRGLLQRMPSGGYAAELPKSLKHQAIQIQKSECAAHWMNFITTNDQFIAILKHNGFEQ